MELKGNTVVVGAQWGDEGKGKIVDILAGHADAVIRYNGGANAGHTLIIDGEKVVLHLLPVGIVRQGRQNFVGPGTVCDPSVAVEELAIAKRCGSKVMLDVGAQIVLPIHKVIDGARERSSSGAAIGTTGRGIGPCYEDLASRRGLVLGDLAKGNDAVRQALERGRYYEERRAVAQLHGADSPSLDETVDWVMQFADVLTPHLGDTRAALARMQPDKRLLFEGAQGMMLDIFQGARPYCTSSSCGRGAVSTTLGTHRFERVIGVSKAYATRVGGGPFPTEMSGDACDRLRERGGEYGATTGRPRRCGWLDLPALGYACRMGGITELVLTKLDVLSGIDQVQVAISYSLGRRPVGLESLTNDVLFRVEPTMIGIEGWNDDLRSCTASNLPGPVRHFIECVEKFTEVPVVGIGTGPDRNDIVWF